MEGKALSGVRILDLTHAAAGPVCTLNLGMMGADVIKVEQPVVGESGRGRGYVYGKQSIKWAVLHSNKKSISLNLKDPEGKKILEDLIKICDVMVENFGPGTIERLGFGWDRVHEINPRIIMCQIKGYHRTNPYGKFGAFDAMVQATSGLASQQGNAGAPPVIGTVALADVPTGDYATMGIVLALFQREHTGKGQRVELNMQEVILSYSRMSFSMPYTKRGTPMQFLGKDGPKNLFPCKPNFEDDENNYCFINVTQRNWEKFCNLMGNPDLANDERFNTGEKRCQNKELESIVSEWSKGFDKVELMTLLGENGFTAGATHTIQEIAAQPCQYESGFLRHYEHPILGDIVLPTTALRLSDSPVEIEHSPDLGEHNDDIYKNLLHMDDEKYKELKEKGVI